MVRTIILSINVIVSLTAIIMLHVVNGNVKDILNSCMYNPHFLQVHQQNGDIRRCDPFDA